MTSPPANAAAPVFSVVVPTYSRPNHIARCLRALAKLEYPSDRFEIIVVDDGTDERHLPHIRDACSETGAILLRQENSGPASARNKGAASARGEYLAFVDDDCEPEPHWLTHLSTHLFATPAAAIGGRTISSLDGNSYAYASQCLLDYLYSYYAEASPGDRRFFASNNLALSRRDFEALGGFDRAFPLAAAEDRDFCNRWLHSRRLLIYAPEAVVRHGNAMGFIEFCRQHFNYGRGALRYHQARARRRMERIQVEPIAFYTDMLTVPFRHLPRLRAARISALLLVSQLANALGFAVEAGGDRLRRR